MQQYGSLLAISGPEIGVHVRCNGLVVCLLREGHVPPQSIHLASLHLHLRALVQLVDQAVHLARLQKHKQDRDHVGQVEAGLDVDFPVEVHQYEFQFSLALFCQEV